MTRAKFKSRLLNFQSISSISGKGPSQDQGRARYLCICVFVSPHLISEGGGGELGP